MSGVSVPAATAEQLAQVGEVLKIDEKKAQLITTALQVVGRRLGQTRQVRVVETTGAPQAAVQVGDAAFIVDLRPAPVGAAGSRGKGGGKSGRGKEGKGGRRGDKRNGPANDRRFGAPADASSLGKGLPGLRGTVQGQAGGPKKPK